MQRLITATAATATMVDMVFGFDADDPELEANLSAVRDTGFYARVAPRQSPAAWWNALLVQSASAPVYQAVMVLSDDSVPLTVGWDQRTLEALAKPGALMVSHEDLSGNGGRPSHVAMTSEAVLALGWIAEPSMRHYCIDWVWLELGNRTGCGWLLADVVIDHVWRSGRAPEDQLRRENQADVPGDVAAYEKWLAERADADAAKLSALMAREQARAVSSALCQPASGLFPAEVR